MVPLMRLRREDGERKGAASHRGYYANQDAGREREPS
jgi:hypothetical protein